MIINGRAKKRGLVKVLEDGTPNFIAIDIRGNSTCCDGAQEFSNQLYRLCLRQRKIVLNLREGYRFDSAGVTILSLFAYRRPSTDIYICGSSAEIKSWLDIYSNVVGTRPNIHFPEKNWLEVVRQIRV